MHRQHEVNVIGSSEKVGLLTIRNKKGILDTLSLCRERFSIVRNRAQSVLAIRRNVLVRFVFVSRLDLGIGFFCLFLRSMLTGNIRHARVMLSLFIGKCISTKSKAQLPLIP